MQKEIWKDVLGYEGLYQVSNLGEIKSVGRLVKCKGGKYRTIKEKIIKPGKTIVNLKLFKVNYFYVNLHKNNKIKTLRVNRLVAQAFLGLDINNRWSFVCHKDDNPENNKLNNIFLGTPKDNVQDMIKKGRDNLFGWRYKI